MCLRLTLHQMPAPTGSWLQAEQWRAMETGRMICGISPLFRKELQVIRLLSNHLIAALEVAQVAVHADDQRLQKLVPLAALNL